MGGGGMVRLSLLHILKFIMFPPLIPSVPPLPNIPCGHQVWSAVPCDNTTWATKTRNGLATLSSREGAHLHPGPTASFLVSTNVGDGSAPGPQQHCAFQ